MLPTSADLDQQFRKKFGDPFNAHSTGPAPRRRYRFGYFNPADVYEACVDKLATPSTSWLDVGGGHDIFPENAKLSRELSSRVNHIVAVDPSPNVLKNQYAQVKVQAILEDYHTDEKFDLATMRMVVEHVAKPDAFVKSLALLLKPGGLAVVFTINKYSPLSLVSRFTPFRLHHPIKKLFWGGEEEDTFPVQYLMNTRKQLSNHFTANGFTEVAFQKLDDASTFGKFKFMNYAELCLLKCFRAARLTYPENCLLAIYRRN